MKRKWLLIAVLAIATLAAYLILGTGYRREGQTAPALATQVDAAAQELAGIAPPPTDLADKLAEAETELAAAVDAFPTQPSSTVIIDTILHLAGDSGVTAVPLVTQPWSLEFVGEEAYAVFRLNVTASGTFASLTDFLEQLETGGPGTLVVTGLTVARDDAAGSGYVNASLDIALYARPDDGQL